MTENVKIINYSIDNILQMLREKDVFQVKDVEIAIVEANGNLSVSLTPDKLAVTVSDMNSTPKEAEYEIPIILDGEIQTRILEKLNKTHDWLRKELALKQIEDETDVFYAGVNSSGSLNLTIKGRLKQDVPPIVH